MHIADVKIPSTWTPLSKYVEVDAISQYVVINSSQDDLYAVEGDEVPANNVTGAIIVPGNYLVYKKGVQAELYIRNAYTPVLTDGVDTQNKLSNVTINKVG